MRPLITEHSRGMRPLNIERYLKYDQAALQFDKPLAFALEPHRDDEYGIAGGYRRAGGIVVQPRCVTIGRFGADRKGARKRV